MTTRTFTDSRAVRLQVPLVIGIAGPSSSGKTKSALRLADGIARVSGPGTFVIDSEAGRALAYADDHTFQHVPFEAPFGPLDYLAAIEHCVARGAKTIVTDSMSHEHEGRGGVLEMHAKEVERLMAAWKTSEEKVNFAAWQKPKSERRRLIDTILQLRVNMIMCFRAREKLKFVPGRQPVPLGWQAIAGEEFVYECSLGCLLPPGCDGVPNWTPTEPGERSMIKLPMHFRSIVKPGMQLSEDIGEQLARWAAGAAPPAPLATELAARYALCQDDSTLAALEHARRELWPNATKDEKALLKLASEQATQRLTTAAGGTT